MTNKLKSNAILNFGMKMTAKKKSSAVLLCVLSGVFGLIIASTVISMNIQAKSGYVDVSDYADTGKVLFFILCSLHMVFSVFLSPAVAGSSISSEREKQTLDLLLCSQMTPLEIVVGKFASSLSWLFMVTVSLLPTYAIIYMIGGVPLSAIICALLFIIWLMTVITAIAVLFSALIKRSVPAIIVSYVTLIGIVVLNFILTGLYYAILENLRTFAPGGTYINRWYNNFICPVLWFNPVVAFIGILAMTMGEVSNSFLFGTITNNMTRDLIITIAVNAAFYSALAFGSVFLAGRALDPMKAHGKEKKAVRASRSTGKSAAAAKE